tara:strand:+ start:13730 stop:14236 length:507 start_codon:yes stop_codon:yes gene_type:complete
MPTTEPPTEPTLKEEQEISVQKYLLFRLADEHYGIPVQVSQEVIQQTQITPIPNVPNFVKGAINLRGKVVPVIDMRTKLEMEPAEKKQESYIIVVEILVPQKGASLTGISVDKVNDVTSIISSQIEDNLELGAQINQRYIEGITKIESKVITLLKIENIILDSIVKAK